ncbi:hypothetical protein N7470_007121 [Penicillium chermesinum]|nr:hypothetical protein N7470_007121 [Penicillium chermesinum]
MGVPNSQTSRNGGILVFDSKMGPKPSSSRVVKRGQLDELHELRHRLRVLENALSKPSALHAPHHPIPETFSEGGDFGTEASGVDERIRYLPDACFRGKPSKSRYFGRSHYTTTLSFFQDLKSFMRRGRGKGKDCIELKKFKSELWSRDSENHQRAFREQAFRLEEMVPARTVADQLVQLYLDTFESSYRILHIPTFLNQYAAYWTSPEHDMKFTAQLLAICAAGSCFYVPLPGHEQHDEYQQPAMKWILAVQWYISCTFVSPEIDFQMLQIQCLLLVARLGTARDGDVSWASSGSLIRSAMTMGLHRDPTRFRKKVQPHWCELRRRLWTTIVELDLKISLDRGVPPSVDLDECDCDAPSNWDDSDLSAELETDPPTPTNTAYTRNFYQTLLATTLPLRYRIGKRINSLKFDLSYDQALKMGEELIQSVQHASSLFDDNASGVSPNEVAKHRFAQSLHLFIIRKFLLALHRPFSLSVVRLPKCSYSRKVCLEASLEILSQMELPSPSDSILYPHITQLGGGMFGDETFHAAVTVCVELSLQSQEIGESCRDADGKHTQLQCPHEHASVKSRVKGEDPLANIEEASQKAFRVARAVVGGHSYSNALENATNPLPQTLLPVGQPTPSGSSDDFDPAALLAADFGDFTSIDFGSWFDGLDSGGAELWDSNLFGGPPMS